MSVTAETIFAPSKKDLQSLENQITELAAHIHAATYRLLELIREYDECEGWGGEGIRSCAHWLNWKCGISLGAGREKVRVAHALSDLPKISAAFRKGEISYSKVRAMTRVATPENEDHLMMIASHGTAAHVERAVRLYRKTQRIETLEAENARHLQREFTHHIDDDGMWVFRGRLTPEQGAVMQKALEAELDAEFAERENVPAETPEDEITQQPEAIASRRADALARVAEAALSAEKNQSSTGDRYLVHIHTEIDTLRKDGDTASAELEDQSGVSAETSRRICCDAGIVHWHEDQSGNPLNIGRKSRTIPPAIRRALKRQDHGCRFPGCTATRFVDGHHIQHWADGGETSLDNLVLLCRHHHRLVHEGGFGVHTDATQNIRFTTPAGAVIPENGADRRSRGNVFALTAQNQRSGIEITPETPIPDWYGERMDDDLAVAGLWQADGVRFWRRNLLDSKSIPMPSP